MNSQVFPVDGTPPRTLAKDARDGDGSAPMDPLLSCLSYIARHHGREPSAERLLGGLPVSERRLPPKYFARAAEKVGLIALIVPRKLRQISKLVLPCVLLLKTGEACILEARDKKLLHIIYPHHGPESHLVNQSQFAANFSGYAIYVTKAPSAADHDQAEGKIHAKKHWFWAVALRFWPSYALIVFAALGINVLGLASPLFIMNVYDRVIPNLAITTLWALASGVVIALAMDFVLKVVRSRLINKIGQKVDMAISTAIFEKILGLQMKDRPASAGGLANKIKEFDQVADFFTSSTIVALTDLVFIGVFAAVLWIIVGPLVYVPLIAVPLVIIVTLLVQFPLRRAIEKNQQEAGKRHSILVEGVVGIEAIKSACAENHVQQEWEASVAATTRTSVDARFWSSLATNFTMLAQQGVSVAIIVWGVYLVADGAISVGALIAANILSGRMLAPLGNIAGTLARAQQAFTAMRGIQGIMDLPDENETHSPVFSRTVKAGGIAFQNVSFTYPNGHAPALKNVTLQIPQGECVGIIGRVGSGKTTIGRLVSGLYMADEGRVLVDGIDIHQYHATDLRSHVGFAAQEAELFSGTLYDNIRLGWRGCTSEDIEEAGRAAGIEEYAAQHPLGYNMPIAERGRSLSGGQKQAVALARILLRKPKILYLDEPSSAMDRSTEAALKQRLSDIARSGITLLISTHRDALLTIVARLFVFDKGALVLDGPRDEVYAKMRELAAQRAAAATADRHSDGQ